MIKHCTNKTVHETTIFISYYRLYRKHKHNWERKSCSKSCLRYFLIEQLYPKWIYGKPNVIQILKTEKTIIKDI